MNGFVQEHVQFAIANPTFFHHIAYLVVVGATMVTIRTQNQAMSRNARFLFDYVLELTKCAGSGCLKIEHAVNSAILTVQYTLDSDGRG